MPIGVIRAEVPSEEVQRGHGDSKPSAQPEFPAELHLEARIAQDIVWGKRIRRAGELLREDSQGIAGAPAVIDIMMSLNVAS